MKLDSEQLRSAEDAGLSIVCGSIAVDDAALASWGIGARSDGDAIVRAATRLCEVLDLDLLEVAGSLADLVQELRWFEEY